MARPYLPQTTASDLCLRVSQLVAKSDRYLGRDSFEARMLRRECEKLQQADKFDGAIASIYLAEAFGDAEQVRRHATQARGGVHARLYTALMHPSVSRTSVQYMKSKSLGYILKAMHAQRIKADYFIDTEVSLQEARAMELQAGGALEI